jgi:hypothetical protein
VRPPEAQHQLSLPLSGNAASSMVRTTRKANKKQGAAVARCQLGFSFVGSKARRRVSLPLVRHPGYSREVVRDAAVPAERELEWASAEMWWPAVPSIAQSPLASLFVLVLYAEQRSRYVRYRAGRLLCSTFDPVDTVPETRAQCPADREHTGCPHVRCRYHLWTVPVAGRPGLADVPRNAQGRTISAPGQIEPHTERLRLEPRWLEPGVMPASCALDVAERGRGGNQRVGHAAGRHRTLVAREIKSALVKASDTAEEQGVDREDFVEALMKMGEER